ncbi:hypothetical protein JHL18_05130 [Clostridium sp. YIM B02505]|uniref:Uncharacterized protein n=1 Tax=Clostridium yunnanense TaxID=2800325 RepID=A0ABS1EKZ2_9CLOT|nr:hypothetical protein [Clostridium yunnanense]MBK1810026.1 hypothetical protein [Clostridium yunnanense]
MFIVTKVKLLISKLYEEFRKSKSIRALWDFIYIGVIGLNSYIWLFHNNRNEPKMKYVIVGMAIVYVVTSFLLSVMFRGDKLRRQKIYLVRKIFRLIYTAVYLTIIMLHLINLGLFDTIPDGKVELLIYNIVMFIVIAITGTISLWWKKVLDIILNIRSR